MTKLAVIEKQRRGIAESQFETETRRRLLGLLQEGKTRLADLADALAMTPAGLRKELSRHQLTFKDLLDSVRKDAASSRLLGTDLSITEIAFSLGYSDCSIFTRACHKWFHKSPREMRSA